MILPLVVGPAQTKITAVTTDKDLYHSNEIMKITIAINSAGNLDNATVSIDCIRDQYGMMRITHDMPVNLSPGPNIFFYEYNLPSCSKCSGLGEGTYQVNVTLLRRGVPLSTMTHSVELKQ